ncbi:MAG TPA: chemotaxis protein CheA [Anaeromyxobacteraceae bacterium]|nr:chemotaxis protein CheA [Anaeromyxobacteraceae bacterium]
MTLETAKYLALFVAEAKDRLAKLGSDLVKLEGAARQKAETAPIVDGLFRHAHSVKGMAASMQQQGIATLAHRAEDLVDLFRRRAATPDPESVDLLLAAVDALTAMVGRAAAGETPEPELALLERLGSALERVRAAGESQPDSASPPRPPAAVGGPPAAQARTPEGEERKQPGETPRRLAVAVEVAASCPVPAVRAFLVVKKLGQFGPVRRASPSVADLKLGRLPGRTLEVVIETASPLATLQRALSQISDLAKVTVEAEGAPSEEAAAPAPPPPSAEPPEGGRTVRVRVELLDSFLDTVGELILATARLRELGRTVPEPYRPSLEEGVDRLNTTVKDLHDQVMAVRMTPLALVTERLPRAARDVARRTGKQVEVEVQGAEIEIDRAILDEVSDGLVHVLRNAVDHGIEPPHLRILAGKPATGRITVTARRERDRVLLEIADDGKGMEPDRLRFSAVAMGALTEAAAAALPDREALLLACLPGVSTAKEVTELSGRGVGMDAVKRTVEALGGALEVASERGQGTRWTLRLPLTVAVQPVLLVDVASEVLGLPIAKVHGAAQVEMARLDTSQGKPVLPYQGKLVPVRDLGSLLGFGSRKERAPRSIVVAEGEGALVGLAVDRLLGQHEAVLKPLLRPLNLVPGLSAVTVLGNGRPVFILDVQRLVAA